MGAQAGEAREFKDAVTKLGWNAGMGVAVGWRTTEVFVETRFTQMTSSDSYRMQNGVGTYTSFTPIVIGLQWF
jgi:hypothetical protein